MIVLDEQLLGLGIEHDIARWYPGNVKFIIDLRPGSVIKDDAIPGLLRKQNKPTFVTINVWDFWRKIPADGAYCVICISLPNSRATEISDGLRALFRLPGFMTKDERMGKVVRIAEERTSYYSAGKSQVERL